jgi:pyruvate/2-oxoglutarate dehydrogenase complex dihydrolipoamide dehydrogenase (E3) component
MHMTGTRLSTEAKASPDVWDVIVVGGGPPGITAAQHATQAGLSAVIVESERVGGECHYWACVPSKALLFTVSTRNLATDMPGLRELVNGRGPDVTATLARRDAVIDHLDDTALTSAVSSLGIDVVRGHGRISGPKTIEVERADEQPLALQAREAIVLSTGSSAFVPPIPGLASAQPWTSRDVTNVHVVPDRVLVIGGGVVACEATTWLSGLGAERLIIAAEGHALLPNREPFVGEILARELEARGVEVRLDTTIAKVERPEHGPRDTGHPGADPAIVTFGDGQVQTFDEIVVAAGRRPNTSELGLENAGVATNARGYLDVDDHMSVPGSPWLYAIADIAGRAALTHMGRYHARVAMGTIVARAQGTAAVRAASSPTRHHDRSTNIVDRDRVPQVIFTDPEIATVGLTEAQARERGFAVQTSEVDLSTVTGAALLREHYVGRAKLVIDRNEDVVVGATFVGASVSELVHAATVAVIGRVPVESLWHAVPSFPTISEVWIDLLETLA